MLNGMHTTQIAVRIPDELLTRLDVQIPARFASRADAVREGLTNLLEGPSRAERVERHRAGWRDHPLSPTDEFLLQHDARALIAEEPW
jgi:Arc/MetJ-type ribon-helix-helix transcriptional regulator